ncbi:MAG: alpha/beta fold hydrolase [Propionibacteriaceae bacterium]|nr:alpha/beta fold hydrolase [Propionibacteriaceae bacterium]
MVTTRVGRLKVAVHGEPQRPTAVLWHSLFVDERTWARVVPDLARDRQLVIVTGPGHGTSGDPGHRYTMADCAGAALEVLDAIGVEGPVDWVGNAWGGHVGIIVAAQHPDRLRTLVAAGTPVHPYRLADRLRTSLLLVVYRWFGPIGYLGEAVASALLSEHTRGTDPSAADLVRECFAGADRKRLTNAVVSVSLSRLDLKPVLPDVQAPTLFITGSAHPDWSPDQMRAAAALLPHGSTQVVDGTAYLVPLEAPTAFSSSVREFWTAHPTGQGRR